MPKQMDVGRSGWRTFAKHFLMNSFVGQEAGVTRNLRGVTRLVWIDLTAGNAALIDEIEWHRSCSPGILAYHAKDSVKPVEIALHEIKPAVFDLLIKNLEYWLPTLGYSQYEDAAWRIGSRVRIRAFNVSGKDASVDYVGRSDAVLVLNDPNAITDWAMRDSFPAEIVSRTGIFRSMSTLGCNPSGIKRGSAAERLNWFDLIRSQERTLPGYRDLLLSAIERDEAQWAYLLSTATAADWRDKTEAMVKSAFRRVTEVPGSRGRTAAMTWFQQDPAEFQETKLRLILTKSERERIRGQEDGWFAAPRAERLQAFDKDQASPDEDLDDLRLF